MNDELTKELNSSYPERLWEIRDIVVYTDGMFGKSRLENIGITFDETTLSGARYIWIEDMNLDYVEE